MRTEEIIQHFLHSYVAPMIRTAVREEFKQQQKTSTSPIPEKEMLSAKEAAEFIGDALPTFYGRTSRKEIPTYGSGKRIFIKKSDLLAWKQKQRTKSRSQIDEEVAQELKNRFER